MVNFVQSLGETNDNTTVSLRILVKYSMQRTCEKRRLHLK